MGLEAKLTQSDKSNFFTYKRSLGMNSTCKISDLWRDSFARYKQANFRIYELFRGKNKDNMLGKSWCISSVEFPLEHYIDRSVNNNCFHLKAETALLE